MTRPYAFQAVPRLNVGAGSRKSLPQVCAQLGLVKPLIVTDRGLFTSGLLTACLDAVQAHGITVAVFDQVLPDPPEKNVVDAVAFAKTNECDGVIGFGGGSPMDVAKLVAVMMAGDQPLGEMYGVDRVAAGRLPLVQIPTTAGTGSEATAVAIITTGESSKAGVVSPVLFADHILLDPQLTLSLPSHVTAATGIDAMVHAIEAFTSVRLKNPLSDMYALQALTLLSANIETVVFDGNDLPARTEMLTGAMLAGQAFANAPVAAVHALAYPLGGTFHIAHGLSNSLMLPHVLRFNSPNCAPLFQQLASVIQGLDCATVKAVEIGDRLADYFHQLAEKIGLQTRLRDMNITYDALPLLAQQAMEQQRLLINNPREVTFDDALALYQEAF